MNILKLIIGLFICFALLRHFLASGLNSFSSTSFAINNGDGVRIVSQWEYS